MKRDRKETQKAHIEIFFEEYRECKKLFSLLTLKKICVNPDKLINKSFFQPHQVKQLLSLSADLLACCAARDGV
jgi:hypothetical protein